MSEAPRDGTQFAALTSISKKWVILHWEHGNFIEYNFKVSDEYVTDKYFSGWITLPDLRK